MILHIRKTSDRLVPCGEESVKVFNKLKNDDEIYVEYKPRRNYKFHKKYWALLNAVLINQEHFKTVDNIHEAVKYRAGYYETIFTFNGESFIKTKSISFHTLDNMEFESFYDTAIDVCVELVGDESVEQIIKFN